MGLKVLLTGASGRADHLVIQLAEEAGAEQIVLSEDAVEAAERGPYWLFVDGVGGQVLGNALGMLDRGGCV